MCIMPCVVVHTHSTMMQANYVKTDDYSASVVHMYLTQMVYLLRKVTLGVLKITVLW